MTFTIEPMLNLGTHEWEMWDDGWTVVTKDRRRSAQFEHTILVTDPVRRSSPRETQHEHRTPPRHRRRRQWHQGRTGRPGSG